MPWTGSVALRLLPSSLPTSSSTWGCCRTPHSARWASSCSSHCPDTSSLRSAGAAPHLVGVTGPSCATGWCGSPRRDRTLRGWRPDPHPVRRAVRTRVARDAGISLVQMTAFASAFGVDTTEPFRPTWSLTVEWTFYVSFPIVLMAMRGGRTCERRIAGALAVDRDHSVRRRAVPAAGPVLPASRRQPRGPLRGGGAGRLAHRPRRRGPAVDPARTWMALLMLVDPRRSARIHAGLVVEDRGPPGGGPVHPGPDQRLLGGRRRLTLLAIAPFRFVGSPRLQPLPVARTDHVVGLVQHARVASRHEGLVVRWPSSWWSCLSVSNCSSGRCSEREWVRASRRSGGAGSNSDQPRWSGRTAKEREPRTT